MTNVIVRTRAPLHGCGCRAGAQVHTGLTDDPAAELDHLVATLVE